MIVIKDGAIGIRTFITARHDVEIGEGAIIGAMALVNKSVPAGTAVLEVSCRVINENKGC